MIIISISNIIKGSRSNVKRCDGTVKSTKRLGSKYIFIYGVLQVVIECFLISVVPISKTEFPILISTARINFVVNLLECLLNMGNIKSVPREKVFAEVEGTDVID